MKKFKTKLALCLSFLLIVSSLGAITAFASADDNKETVSSTKQSYELIPVSSNGSMTVKATSSSGIKESPYGDKYYYVQRSKGGTWESPETGDIRVEFVQEYTERELSGNAIGGKTVYSDFGARHLQEDMEYFSNGDWDYISSSQYQDLDIQYVWFINGAEYSKSNELVIPNVTSKMNKSKYVLKCYVKDFDGNNQVVYSVSYIVVAKSAKICMYYSLGALVQNVPSTLSMKKNSSVKLKQWVRTGDKFKSWTSSNSNVVSISRDGVVKAKKTGTATITATSVLGAKEKCKITVKNSTIAIKSIKVGYDIYLSKGEKTNVKQYLLITPVTYSKSLSYKTSNAKVATVSKNGVVTAKKNGKCKITITGGNSRAKISVLVE